MRIRSALAKDAEAITRLLTQLGYSQGPGEVEPRLRDWLADPASAVLVAESDGELAGVLALHACPYLERAGRFARIGALVVDQSRRRDGIGRRLVEAAHRKAGELGCVDMEVMTHRDRSEAEPFYRALGYEDVCSRSARFMRSVAKE